METGKNNVPIFVSTNVDTHLVISSSPSDTVGDLRGKIKNAHLFCFPHCGDIDIRALMVKCKSLVYHLADSIFVETAFHGSNGTRYLLAEVSGSELCNQQECKILSGKDGNLGLLTKSENGKYRRQLDEKSNGTSLDVQNGKSNKKNKSNLVTEGLQVNIGHGQFINNEECMDLVVAIEEKVVTNDEFAKDSKALGSRDKTSEGDKKIMKTRKNLHNLKGNLAECVLSPCKEKGKRNQTTEKAENIAQCLSERVLENIEMDKSSLVGQIIVSEKVSTLNDVKDNDTKDVLMTAENLCCEQQSLLRNIHADGDGEHVTGRELGTGRKHEKSLKIFNQENSLNGAGKELDGLQGKADDARECDTETKIKSKRNRSSKSFLDDDIEICRNDVNGVPQITKQNHLQEYKHGKTVETSGRECDTEKKLNHKRKMSSMRGFGNGDHKLSTKDVNDEPQMTKHTHLLEYKCHKPEKTCGASFASDKSVHTSEAASGPVKYLDVATHTESHQQFNVCGKRKNKRSKIDISMIDCQEKITIEPVQRNDAKNCTGEGDERITDERGRNISSENEVTYLNVQHSKKNVTTDLEHVPETIGTTALANDQNCKDKKKVKSSRNSPSTISQERTFNVEIRGNEKVVAKVHGASIVLDKNVETKNAMSAPVKYLDVSNNMEDHQQCNITGRKKNKHSRNDTSRVDAQEIIATEEVPKNDIAVNFGKGERDVSTPDAGHKNRSENGGVKYLNAHHSKTNAARDLDHFMETIGTTPMVNNEDCNVAEELKLSKNNPSKNSYKRTANFEKREIDEVVAKGCNSMQNVRDEEKKPKDTYLPSEILSVCGNKTADSGFKSNISAVPEGSVTNQSRKAQHVNNSVEKKHQSVDRNLVQKRKGSADVGCKLKKTTSPGFGTSNTNHLLGRKEDTGIGVLKFQSTAENCAQKSLKIEKLDTNDLSYMRESLKELQGDANFTEKIQPENEKVAPQRNILESCGHNLKKKKRSSTADTTQSSEKKEDNDFQINNDRPQGEDWLYDRKDNSVSCTSQKQTPVFVVNDVYGDSQCAGEETEIDGKPGKLQLAGRTHDGLRMDREISKNTISCQMEKSVKKPKVDNHSKKNHISLFRSSSDVSTEGENENDSYTVSSSSKGFSSDSSDSYDSDAGNRDKISKIQLIKPQTGWEPSISGVRLSTAVGKKEDYEGSGFIHSKFVHLLARKTGLGELFKIARAQQKPESDRFGGDFLADDSPSVDMVLETQDSQIDPVFNAPNNSVLTTSRIIADETKEEGKMLNAEVPTANSAMMSHAEEPKVNSALKSEPDGTHKVPLNSNSLLPSNNSVQLKKPRKAFNK